MVSIWLSVQTQLTLQPLLNLALSFFIFHPPAPSAAPAFWRRVKQTDMDGWRHILLLWKVCVCV